MTRLVIDARLAGHSGIGTYLSELLPRVVPALAAWRPAILCAAARRSELTARFARDADVVSWDAAPLSVADLWSSAPVAGPHDLLWTPHFNVPLRSLGALAVTLHDLLPLTAPALAGYGRSLPLRAWLRAIRGRARAVFCVSEFTRGEALRLAALDPELVHVTALGVDRAWHVAAEAAASNAQPATPTMIFVGLLKPHKNVSRLLRAFARVRDRIAHRLVLVARHHGIRNVDREALALAAQHADRVDLVADLPFAELVARVASAQFAVQPSLHEGFGLPALEAMAAGVPVLAGRAGALPEVCGDAALYCDPLSEDSIAESLLLLASNPALRLQLAAAGRARARSFSWDSCTATTTLELTRALRRLHEVPQ
ncbi:MAG: glycosyltransferase family 4 protein [Burkholderiales bacterium]|nr:glycosyltransferase family 4 protein [Burkholderiales bacterium]